MDYTKQCWYCGKRTMKPDARGFRCKSCGATFNKLPRLEASPISPGFVIWTNGKGQRYQEGSLKPSKSLASKVRKEREGKK